MTRVRYMTREQIIEEKEQELKEARIALQNYLSMNASEDTISDQEDLITTLKQEFKELKGVV